MTLDELEAAILPAVEKIGRGLGRHEDWMPTLHLVDALGRTTIVGLSFPDEAKPLMFNLVLPALVRKEHTVALATVTTAWMSKDVSGNRPPSEDPERVEIVLVVLLDQSGGRQLLARVDRSGRHPRLSAWERMEGELEGRMVDPLRAALREGLS